MIQSRPQACRAPRLRHHSVPALIRVPVRQPGSLVLAVVVVLGEAVLMAGVELTTTKKKTKAQSQMGKAESESDHNFGICPSSRKWSEGQTPFSSLTFKYQRVLAAPKYEPYASKLSSAFFPYNSLYFTAHRERNREHAKRSRVRKKFLLESLQQSVNALQQENDKLRGAIKEHLGPPADKLLASCATKSQSLIASNPSDATRILDDPDYSLVKALQTAQQNFVITDPSLPDNPIVFASGGFLTLTGYTLDQVLGRNCRFLQGPQTDPRAVAKIRQAVADGYDASVCLLNYKIDGTTFWNQFFVAPLRDSEGGVVNYVGVQCKVSDDFARAIATSDVAETPTEATSDSTGLPTDS